MRLAFTAVAALALALVASGCAGSATDTTVDDLAARPEATTTTSTPVSPVAPVDEPAAGGTAVALLGYRVTIDDMVAAGGSPEAPDGPATVAVTLVNITAERLDPASDLSFAVIAADGGARRHYDCDVPLGPDALLDGSVLYPGGMASGLVCFELEGASLDGATVMVTGAARPLAVESTSFWAA